MNSLNQNFTSNTEAKRSRPWLQAHYEARKKRTVDLVKASVDRLAREKQAVTIEAVCRLSKEIDPLGKGVKKAGILGNVEAHAYYQKHSLSYQIAQGRKRPPTRKGQVIVQALRIDPDRDVKRVRQRYLKQTKADLVDRLLMVEQAYAQGQMQLARLQFELIEIQQKQEEDIQREQRNRRQKAEESHRYGALAEQW
jgi:hypothetical protein